MKKKVWIILTFLVVLAAAGGIYYYGFYLPDQEEPAPTYNTSKVHIGDIIITASGVGNILPAEKVSVGFQMSGVVQSLTVNIGDTVSSGDILACLDDVDLQLKLSQAESNLRALFTAEALNQAELNLLTARTNFSDAENELIHLISPYVYNQEIALEEAQLKLEQLRAKEESSADEIEAAEEVVVSAENSLTFALQTYDSVYVVETFAYSYIDDESNTLIMSYLKPSGDSIALARAKLKLAEFALEEGDTYLTALQSGIDGLEDLPTAATGSNLGKLLQAKLDYDKALADVEKSVLVAPISGTVTALNASVGQSVNNEAFITIETLNNMILKFYVEERDISLVKTGNQIEVIFDAYPNDPVIGNITYIEPTLQTFEGNPVAAVWAALTGPVDFPLLSGMSADVEVIAAETRDALLVPVQAMREISPGSYSVFVVQPDGSLRMVVVTVGLQDFANAEILSGLKQGDVVSTGDVETK